MAEKKYCYDYPRPALTVDCVLFGFDEKDLFILLIERGKPPFQGQWALPGGFVGENETTETAVQREMKEETNLSGLSLTQLKTYSEPNRDPRHRTVSVVYTGLVNYKNYAPKAGDDAAKFAWFSIADLPRLAFDHKKIVDDAIDNLSIGLEKGTYEATYLSAEEIKKVKRLI